MNLVGINNENEFYTNHYLNEIFEGDIKGQIGSWQKQESESETYKTPFRQIKGMGTNYFGLLKQLQNTKSSTEKKLEESRAFYKSFFDTLGYETELQTKELQELSISLLGELRKNDGTPYLWIVESFCSEPCDVLTTTVLKEQLEELNRFDGDLNYDAIVSSHVFTLSEPPRWVLLVSPYQIVLIERAKYAQKRFLRFDIEEILARKEDSVLKAFSVLLHKESLAPTDGLSLLDTLDENSYKHAFGVTEDLKYSLRSAVELMGNETIYAHLKRDLNFLEKPNLEAELTREALRYMYRMLFLFYIESRPELGFIPSKSQAFLKGYSLESLRDLELMPLLTEADRDGYFFDESIKLYFDMIYNGRQALKANLNGKDIFSISPLRSHLFDPSRTPLLNQVKLRNHVWQEIIQSLSLSRPKKGKGRGRISYANLGINQLGAVYEALLSYKGFIATESLYEVKKAKTNPTELENAYFVTESQLGEYSEDERVFNTDKTIKEYSKGSFIYRLAGRDREKSASYYTPEVLTKSLVKYALKELLQIDDKGNITKSSDEILKLTVCEPAMGSAAFINEAINQLSEFYLEKKQLELKEKIPHDQYTVELQKVKMYIADNNVYGVDLNSTAVELAEISIWLNALSGAFVPWFGFQLENGNSLIGARREVYTISSLTATKKALLWYEDTPKRLTPKSLWLVNKRKKNSTPQQGTFDIFEQPKQPKFEFEPKEETKSAGRHKQNEVYHFLLGDKAMALYKDKVVKSLKTEQIETINKWRREFIKPYTEEEVELLLKLSLSIDKLWQEHTRHLNAMKQKTTDTLYVWGQKKAEKQQSNIEYKDSVFMQEKLSDEVKSSSPYKRLKMVMDYWCSLWFWSIEKAHELPSRAEYLADIASLVEKQEGGLIDFNKPLFADDIDETAMQKQLGELGVVDVEELISQNPRLQTVQTIAEVQKFLHWELEFADIFAKNGGFDLILGNPPWLKVEWNEGGIMGEANPIFDIRKFSASKLNQLRDETFENYPNLLDEYISEYESADATQNFLNAVANYPLLKGVQTNLYKCFLPTGWKIANHKGVSGFLHPEGVYDDPKGGKLRAEIYKRLKYHFQFQNGKNLFEIAHRAKYSTNVFNNANKEISFINISNLFLPQTIEASFEHYGDEIVGGIKDDENNWNIKGHKSRIVKIDKKTLELFAKLYDEEGTPYLEARLPALHSVELISVLEKFASYPKRLSDIKDEYYSTVMFDETYAQRDGIIKRNTTFVDNPNDLILSGPHFMVGNPLYKTPRAICTEKGHYDILDLTNIGDDYLPRTNYTPLADDYEDRIPTVDFGDGSKKVKEFYRIFFRAMIGSAGERTLTGSIVNKGFGHTNGVRSIIFKNNSNLINLSLFSSCIIADFFMKSTGRTNLHYTWETFPLIDINNEMLVRTLSLTCLTTHYKELYEEQYKKEFTTDSWTKKDDPRLNQIFFKNLTPTWQRAVALRTDYERRQALVEIDVLVAMELKLTIEELKTIYRIQFPVLKQNENETFYDMNGRIVFTVSKGLTGVGLPRKANKQASLYKIVIDGQEEERALGWEDIKEMQSGEVHRTIMDDTMPNGPIERTIIYVAPFAKCDREKDYEVAWAEFEKRNIKND